MFSPLRRRGERTKEVRKRGDLSVCLDYFIRLVAGRINQ